jgi:hypothetical protein
MSRKVIRVTPVAGTASLLSDLFSFHGKIARSAVVDEVGWVEFEQASSCSSALLFDKTTLAGKQVSVVIAEDPPEEVWTQRPDEPSSGSSDDNKSSSFDEVGESPESPFVESADVDIGFASEALPPAAPLPPPKSTAASSSSTNATTSRTTASVAKPAVKAAAAKPAAASKPAAAAGSVAANRQAALAALAKDPINSPMMLLYVTLAIECVLIAWFM